jgi:hypothetical protein
VFAANAGGSPLSDVVHSRRLVDSDAVVLEIGDAVVGDDRTSALIDQDAGSIAAVAKVSVPRTPM